MNPKVFPWEQKAATMPPSPTLGWTFLEQSEEEPGFRLEWKKHPPTSRDSTSVEPRFESNAFAYCSTENNKLYNIWLFGEGVEVMSQKHSGRVWVVVGLSTRLPINGFDSYTAREWNYGSSSIIYIDDFMNFINLNIIPTVGGRRAYNTMNKSPDSRATLPWV